VVYGSSRCSMQSFLPRLQGLSQSNFPFPPLDLKLAAAPRHAPLFLFFWCVWWCVRDL